MSLSGRDAAFLTGMQRIAFNYAASLIFTVPSLFDGMSPDRLGTARRAVHLRCVRRVLARRRALMNELRIV